MFERNPDKSIDVTADGAVALVDDFATAGEQEEISTPPMSDKRGYVKSSAEVGDAEPMAASDVAFLAPELVSEAEGPVPVPAPAEGRLGYRFVKRAFDIAFSLCAIAVLLVPSIILCVAIRLESPGCPIYSQKRVGRIGRSGEARTFDMYKFRSMHKDADERLAELAELNEADGPLFKIKDDPRVTRIGKFIRKHSMAPVIIGTPGDGEPTKSLSHPENSSLDLQKCERRPGTSLGARHHYTNFQFLSFAVFGGPEGASGRPLCACVQAPFAAVGTVA